MTALNFTRTLEFHRVPPFTRHLVKTCLLDIIGTGAGALRSKASGAAREYAVEHHPAGRLGARLLFDGRRVHPLGAAYAGGFTIDSLDAHEGHFTSKGHAGATVVPAILALVDAYRAGGSEISGKELLALLTIGYEVSLRSGVALMASATDYHASGAFSGLGVVMAASRLLDLDSETTRHALGIAEYFGPRCPMMRLIDHPSMLRDAHGAGAYAGINAVLMAKAGITGAPAVTVEDPAYAPQWSDLGSRWEIDAQYFKPWPVCRWAQAALSALTQLMKTHEEVRADNVVAIRVETFSESVRLQGYTPANEDEAQYALAFPLAALLVRGQLGAAEVIGDAIHSPEIIAACQKITIVEADDLSARFPGEILSRVHVETRDGLTFSSETTVAKGDPLDRMSDEEFVEKYNLLAYGTLGQARADAIREHIDALEESPDCAGLLELLLSPR
ncbi:MmgE/PrpD family protein [Pseudomonas matsuisoli]|uniref:2-methylcitrate dehydratase n=1 Tax=Pseudomonas matsuisoli TaxID=1515666 RepID=A0A917PUX8_9PSED|nr:MmgE/PrpD family protein [Pseudomonas matsuisoli]GGJ93811.1 2-methylcitrate dehydratase [Pseudomonas matsuisoli]